MINLNPSFGGAEVYLVNLVDILPNESIVFSVAPEPALARRLAAKGVKTIDFPFLTGNLGLFRVPLLMAVLPYIILAHGIDTVHVNGYIEALALIPAKLLKRRTISTRHLSLEIKEKGFWNSPRQYIARMAYLWCVGLADTVVCVSEAVYKEMLSATTNTNLVCIPNWVPARATKWKPKAKKQTQVLFVGRLYRSKGCALLLQALYGIPNVEIVIAGEGEERERLEQQSLGMNVKFLGFISDPTPLYQDADVFVMPSLGPEGLPLVTLEAMGIGVPCVLSDLPVHMEITGNGDAAVLFRSGDAKHLRQQLLALIDNKVLQAKLSQAARQRVMDFYSPSAARSAYEAVFSNL